MTKKDDYLAAQGATAAAREAWRQAAHEADRLQDLYQEARKQEEQAFTAWVKSGEEVS